MSSATSAGVGGLAKFAVIAALLWLGCAEGPRGAESALNPERLEPTMLPVVAELTATTNEPVSLHMGPAFLAFGNQPVGSPSEPQTVTVTNTGSGTVLVTGLSSTSGAYTPIPPVTPFTLMPGVSVQLSVVFTPPTRASFPDELRLTTGAATSPTASVDLSGTGVTVLEMNPATAIDFGGVPRGDTVTRTVALTNASGADIQLTSAPQVGAPFAVTGPAPGTIPAHSTVAFEVSFTPTSAGPFSTLLSVQSDAVNTPHVLRLDGTGVVPQVQFSSPVPAGNPPGPAIAAMDLGNVQVNTTRHVSVRLSNTGLAPLELQEPAQPGNGFSVSGLGGVTLQPGNFVDFQVSFRPSDTVLSSATLTVTSNAANSPTVLSLMGVGVRPELQLSRSVVSFGNARVGADSAPVSITLINTGAIGVTLQNLPVVGNFAVRLPENVTLPWLIPERTSFTFDVVFQPSAQGVATGSLSVISDIISSQPLGVELSGNGTTSGVLLSVLTLDFAPQRVMVPSSTQPVVLINPGAAELEITGFVFSNSAFELSSQLPLPTPAAPLRVPGGGQETLLVTFTPSAPGPTEGRLFIISNAFTPAVPLPLRGMGVDGQVSVFPGAITFAGVAVGNTGAQQFLKLTNSGQAPLVIKSVTAPADAAFSISDLPVGLVLQPGGEWPFTVTFKPVRRGYASTFASIVSDAKLNPSFLLPLEGTGLDAALSLYPRLINFSTTNVGFESTQNLVIANQGEQPLFVSYVSFEDVGGAGGALDFSLVGATFPLMVMPGASTLLPLKFTPHAIGVRQAKAIVHTNDKDPANVSEALLTGTGTSPRLELSSTDLDFGNVLLDTPSTPRRLGLTNTGTGPITLTTLSLGGADPSSFIVTPIRLPLTLQPNSSTEIFFSLRPDAERSFAAQVVMGLDDALTPSITVKLSGTGVRQQIRLSPSSLDFGRILINNSSMPRSVHVTNNSSVSATLTTFSVDGPGASQFSLENLPLPLVLLPGEEQVVRLLFTPQTDAEVSCTLKLGYSDGAQPLELPLRGKGVPAVLSVKPSLLDFGGVRAVGVRHELPLTLTNLGSDPITLAEPKVATSRGEPFIVDLASLKDRQLEPGKPVIVMVGYQPTEETLSETLLSFGTSTPQLPKAAGVQLKAAAIPYLLGVTPERLDFGTVDANVEVEPREVTVINRTAQTQRVLVKLKELAGTAFTVSTPASINAIPPGGSVTFTVDFQPQQDGATEDVIEVWMQGEAAPEVVIPVTGNGTAASVGGACGAAETGSAGTLALLLLGVLRSRRQRARAGGGNP